MENQLVAVTQAHKIFTHASVPALIETVAGAILQMAPQWQRDRWYFLGSERRLTAPPLPPGWTWSEEAIAGFHVGAEIKHRDIGSQAVSPSWRALGLSAQIRVRWFPDPDRPKNTPVFLLIDFRRYVPLTEDELRLREAEVPALADPPAEAYQSQAAWEAYCAYEQRWQALYGEKAQALAEMRKHFYTPQRMITVRVWLDHAHNPRKAIRRLPRELKGNPKALANWRDRILDGERKARTQQLAQGGASFAWNWLCISRQSSSEDIAFWLLLYLCQEQMTEETPDVVAVVTRYLRPFFKGVKEEGMIYEVFGLLKKHYALPEHWKSGQAYITRIVRNAMKKSEPQLVFGIDPEVAERQRARKPRGRGHSRGPEGNQPAGLGAQDSATRLYTISEVVRRLRQEAPEGAWVPSGDTLYDWGDAGLFSWHRAKRNQKCLDDDGLNAVRARIEKERAHRNLIERAKEVGMSPANIKKASQRGRLQAIIARYEAKQRHGSRDTADPGEDTPSPEELWALARSRLDDPTLTEDERNTFMEYLSGRGR